MTAARTTGQAEGEHVAVLARHPLVSYPLIAFAYTWALLFSGKQISAIGLSGVWVAHITARFAG